jgi:hypothetical protein
MVKKKKRTGRLTNRPFIDRGINMACLDLDTIAAKYNNPMDTTCKRTLKEQWYNQVKNVYLEIERKASK